jgi:tRNA pseudouridine55 synthase
LVGPSGRLTQKQTATENFTQYHPAHPEQRPDFNEGALFLVNKPLHWTSFDVVNKLRFKLRHASGNRKIKVGHAGTLDPMATGLLIICSGAYTKRIDMLMGMDKTYTGSFRLGCTTASYDLECEPDAFFPTDHITPELINAAIPAFLGPIMQVPPIYSAIKVDGQKAYVAARKGQAQVMAARPIIINEFKITDFRLPEALDFEINCSKGTYIRSIAHDFGAALQSGACLSSLCRTAIGHFSIADAWEIDALAQTLHVDA